MIQAPSTIQVQDNDDHMAMPQQLQLKTLPQNPFEKPSFGYQITSFLDGFLEMTFVIHGFPFFCLLPFPTQKALRKNPMDRGLCQHGTEALCCTLGVQCLALLPSTVRSLKSSTAKGFSYRFVCFLSDFSRLLGGF